MIKEQIDILKEVFEEWLQIHYLDYDFWIYSGDEWRARGEELLQKAELVIAFENQLVSILNYTGPWDIARLVTSGTSVSTRSTRLRRCHLAPRHILSFCRIHGGRRRGSGYFRGALGVAKSVATRDSHLTFTIVITASAECRGSIQMGHFSHFAAIVTPSVARQSCGFGRL